MKRLLVVILGLCGALAAFDFLAPHTAARLLLRLERARCGLEARRIDVADLSIAYLAGGAGEPLILIHGFGGDKDTFTRVSAYLTPRYRILIPDLPGFGDSSKPEGASYTIASGVELVRAFARTLGVGRVHLGGSSMGGFIATQYALTYPDEVGSLWLLGPAGTRVAFDSELIRQIERSGENALLSRTPEDFARTMDFVMSRKPFIPYSVRRVMAESAAANYALHSRIFREVSPEVPTVDERLHALTTPTLIVWGKEDRVLNPKAADTYRAVMPDAQVILMDGIGHLPIVEAPEETALAYLRFRARLEPR